jgi:formylglycine-generating enzyme required for sulfatase activity
MAALVDAGSRVGRYVLLRRLGMGGFAEVWEAEDQELRRKVAIKIALPSLSEEPEFVARFLREARLAASLEHPNILAVHDVGTQEGRPFLVMPVVPGGTLAGRMTPPPPIGDALRWLRELAAALDHAHSEGVIHRDVKPQNALFDRKGRLVLADFGIGRSLEESTVLTHAGAAVGTPAYMSPEQALGEPDRYPVGPASDQYSLGVVAYRMLTGRGPFDGPTFTLLRKTIEEPPPPPSTFRSSLSQEVDAVFGCVLAKRPTERFESCEAFVASLSNVLAADAAPPRESVGGDGIFVTPAMTPPLPLPLRQRPSPIAVDQGTDLVSPRPGMGRRDPGATGEQVWTGQPTIASTRVGLRVPAGPAVEGRPPRTPAQATTGEAYAPTRRKTSVGAIAASAFGVLVVGACGVWFFRSPREVIPPRPAVHSTPVPSREPEPTPESPVLAQTATPPAAPSAVPAKAPVASPTIAPRPTSARISPLPMLQPAAGSPVATRSEQIESIKAGKRASPATGPKVERGGIEWVRIRAGRFTMGCTEGDPDCSDREKPPHEVRITKTFLIAATETTNGQYRQCVKAGACKVPQKGNAFSDDTKGDQPVVFVDWKESSAFCEWVGGRLPTEAEWEYAARGGVAGWRYPWGNEITRDDASFAGTGERDRWKKTNPVKSFRPNVFGLYGMAGNVWEWCADWFDAESYRGSPVNDPKGPATSEERVLRGGCWNSSSKLLRVSARAHEPGTGDERFGFRCVRNVSAP